MEIPLTEAIVEMAAGDAGIAFMGAWSVAPQVASGRIVARPLGESGLLRAWYAVTLLNRPKVAYLTEFVKLLTMSGSATTKIRLQASAATL